MASAIRRHPRNDSEWNPGNVPDLEYVGIYRWPTVHGSSTTPVYAGTRGVPDIYMTIAYVKASYPHPTSPAYSELEVEGGHVPIRVGQNADWIIRKTRRKGTIFARLLAEHDRRQAKLRFELN